MVADVTWVGQKRVAFVPVTRGVYNEFPIPPDWPGDIERRIYFDLDQVKRVDVSLRNYIQMTSYGRADLVGEVRDVVEVDRKDVEPADLEPELGPTLRAVVTALVAVAPSAGAIAPRSA